MSGPRNPYCSRSGTGFHSGLAIGYEKVAEGPKYESRGTSIAITEAAYFRYFVVRACRHCDAVWWEEHQPEILSPREAEDRSFERSKAVWEALQKKRPQP